MFIFETGQMCDGVKDNVMFCCPTASGPEQAQAGDTEATEDTEDNPEDPRSHSQTYTYTQTQNPQLDKPSPIHWSLVLNVPPNAVRTRTHTLKLKLACVP